MFEKAKLNILLFSEILFDKILNESGSGSNEYIRGDSKIPSKYLMLCP